VGRAILPAAGFQPALASEARLRCQEWQRGRQSACATSVVFDCARVPLAPLFLVVGRAILPAAGFQPTLASEARLRCQEWQRGRQSACATFSP